MAQTYGGGDVLSGTRTRSKAASFYIKFLNCRGKMSKEIYLQTGSSQEKMISIGSSAFGAVPGGKAGGTQAVPFQRIMWLDLVFPKLHLHELSWDRGRLALCPHV